MKYAFSSTLPSRNEIYTPTDLVNYLKTCMDRLRGVSDQIILYGAGKHSCMLFDQAGLTNADVAAVIDDNFCNRNTSFRDLPGYPSNEATSLPEGLPVLISSTSHMTGMHEHLLSLGVEPQRIVELYNGWELARMAALASACTTPPPSTPRSDLPLTEEHMASKRISQGLDKLGFSRSLSCKRPVTFDGLPYPWFTYSAIQFLDQLDLSEATVFEWGSGYSSLYFARRCRLVHSVDTSTQWHKEISSSKPRNLKLSLRDVSLFAETIEESSIQYDIIVIDAERRLDCAALAVYRLKPGGIILLDNADNCPRTCKSLRDNGFTQIDFYGIGPIALDPWVTSMFVKSNYSFKPISTQPVVPPNGLARDLDNYLKL